MQEQIEGGVDHLVEGHRPVGVVSPAQGVEGTEERRGRDDRMHVSEPAGVGGAPAGS